MVAMGVTDIVTYQPFKGLWVLLAVLINAVKFPFYILLFILPSSRQHQQWTFQQALRTHIVKTFLWHSSVVRVHTPLTLKPTAKEGKRLVRIPISSDRKFYTGIALDKVIKPTAICGFWYPSPYDPKADATKKIVLHFHGGAYVIGDCRPAESGFAGSLIAKNIGKNLQVTYRLASNAGGHFPAALQDAISAYTYLLSLGVPAKNIVLSGDSAGGNLTIALLRYIATTNGLLPDPHAALLWSPWVDVEVALEPNNLQLSPYKHMDYITANFAQWGASSYVPVNGPVKPDSEWVSPKKNPFKSNSKIWIQACGQEVLYHDIEEFHEGMKKVNGSQVGWYKAPLAVHDLVLVGDKTGFASEAQETAHAAARWLYLGKET